MDLAEELEDKMFIMPSTHQQYLRDRGLTTEIYAAMDSDDYADVVMAAFQALEKSGGFPRIPRVYKCETKSNEYRDVGNLAFKMGNYNEALESYNRALMYAPNNSRAIKLAYSNRSAVFLNRKQFHACKVDIEHCFQLGCPSDIIEKLKKRMASVKLLSDIEAQAMLELKGKFADIFKLGTERNPQIPCVSANVEVVKKDSSVKIVAAKDIKVGTLLALEPSFVSCNNEENVAFSCHYCHKMSLNLIPCDRCCFVMFCDEKCKKLCFKDFHSIECQIMELIEIHICSPMAKLMVKGVIKIVQLCESWEEIKTISHCTGSKRISTASVQEMFDGGNKLSVLCYNDDKLFVHGSMYVASFFCATIIYYLEKVPDFFPRLLGERKTARETLGRLLMYFALYAEPTQVVLTVSNRISSITYSHPHINHGWYPFVGKLRQSCTPNVIVSNLNKTAALIASQPIEKGTELTVSYM
ncbi:SET and MYND domain-containing protein 4 [Papilio machaon]|uniref:SET and MYND domain-containing protein 4 n=1 Tax=Papilio machaon TaxID=76193 RepID=A0A194RK65_PAPMA|nr:SET and MYND domain-containing protein 4 [Papilio machaon]